MFLTDAKLNLPCLFEPDFEVVTYTSQAEAVSKLRQLIEQPEAARTIANRGQARTLKHHTYTKRMTELVTLLQQHWNKNRGTFPSQPPKPQTIAVACASEDLNQIPPRVFKALKTEHQHHQLFLISDANNNLNQVKGIKCWHIIKNTAEEIQTKRLLETIKPDQVLIIEKSLRKKEPATWITQLKRTIELLNITFTIIESDQNRR